MHILQLQDHQEDSGGDLECVDLHALGSWSLPEVNLEYFVFLQKCPSADRQSLREDSRGDLEYLGVHLEFSVLKKWQRHQKMQISEKLWSSAGQCPPRCGRLSSPC